MNKAGKYCFFVGTQAELIKLLPVIKEFQSRNIPFTFIASGQNPLPESLLQGIEVDIYLYRTIIFQHMLWVLSWFFKTIIQGYFIIQKRLGRVNNGYFIVQGDTISTLMGAVLGRLLGYRIVHIEAGLRSFNLKYPFPEEIDRLLVSTLSSYHFCPNDWAVNNLRNVKGIKVNTKQNTLWEHFNEALKRPIILPKELEKPYFLFVIHRQENLFSRSLMELLIHEVLTQTKHLNAVFILHGPTHNILVQYDLMGVLQENRKVILLPRQDYYHFTHILAHCEFMVTDGGSNQEEAYYLGKPCLLLRSVTERIEGLKENVVLSSNDTKVIRQFFKTYRQYKRPALTCSVSPSSIIVDTLVQS